MPQPPYYCLLLKSMLVGGVLAFSSCSRYPIDVCRCLEIVHFNSLDIGVVEKDGNDVILAPSALLVKRIRHDALVLSNLKSQELIQNPDNPGHRFWEGGGSWTEEGYFLHQCGRVPRLIPLGMDRERAIALALELVDESKKESNVQTEVAKEYTADD